MATTKAQQKAVHKYVKENYDRIGLTMPKGKKEEIKAHADQYDGGSINAFVIRAIAEQMQRDQAAADHQPTQAPQAPVKPVTALEAPAPAAPAEEPQRVTSPALAHIHAQQEKIWAAGELIKLKALQNKKITYESMLAKGPLKTWQEEDYQKTLAALAAYEDQQDQ